MRNKILFFINQFVVFYNGLDGLIHPNYSKLFMSMISLSMSIQKRNVKIGKLGNDSIIVIDTIQGSKV